MAPPPDAQSRGSKVKMIRNLARLLPASLRFGPQASVAVEGGALAGALREFRAVADVEIDFSNRETLKKYVGVRDHLSREPGASPLALFDCILNIITF